MVSTASAFLAAIIAIALFRTNLIAWIQYAFVTLPEGDEFSSGFPTLALATLLLSLTSLIAALVVDRVGARQALPYLGGALVGFAILSSVASRFFEVDILFIPIVMATALTVLLIQTFRLWTADSSFTRRLAESSSRLSPPRVEEARSRLQSGLNLLDTMLSPREAIVFHRDQSGHLVSVARLRTSNGEALNSIRNSTWRKGLDLCERSIKKKELITEKVENEEHTTNVALPLQHEDRVVGALLIRLDVEFENDDKALLSALGAQLARNLQRAEVYSSAVNHGGISYLSVQAKETRFGLLDVLNGLLSEQRFGVSALSAVSDGIAIAYLDGTLAYVNPALLQFARLSEPPADLQLLDLLNTLRTALFEEPAIAFRRVLQTGEPYERELQFSDLNQTLGLRIDLVFDHAEQTQQPLCLAVTVKDLTRLREHERLKSDMISLMSHELRTPITSINGFAELLANDDELPDQAKEFVTIIATESQRLSRMINTFLAVTQLERKDKQEVLKIPLRLDDVVRETLMNLQPVAKKKRIRLVEHPSQRIPPVAADKSLISQAVKNLVSNAIKYSPERTTVTVSTALEAETVRVTVEDRGFGIPSEAVDRVWEKFFRVVREGQDKDDESTGLGLSFVREVVEQHGGGVNLETEEGRGSKFSFTLPRL